jgi:mannose-6-phosphate isomerase-like protein (cupin superfamily)
MPKTSKATADTVNEFGPATDRVTEMDGYTASFVSIHQTHSLVPILANLPTGNCTCPHWGYVFSGKITLHCGDGSTEVYEAGDAFYMAPGHAPDAEGGSEFVMFSPTDELKATEDAIKLAMASK